MRLRHVQVSGRLLGAVPGHVNDLGAPAGDLRGALQRLEAEGRLAALLASAAAKAPVEPLADPRWLSALGDALRYVADTLDAPAPGTGGAAAGAPRLVVVHGDVVGRNVALDPRGDPEALFVIGRGPDAAVPLHDAFVSTRHAAIVATENGHLILDLESRNGTSVNLQPLQGGRAVPLADHDLIGVGCTVLQFRA